MGQDKAALIIDDKPLWRHQITTLEAVGASEILISGRSDGPYAESGYRIIEDIDPGFGPLGGIVSAFEAARHSMLLVLAVDLPRMTSAFLRSMLPHAPIVPLRGERFEPLAAVYSMSALEVFRQHLARHQLSMQNAVRELVERGDLAICEVAAEAAALFDNLNTPEDLAYFVRGE